MPLHLLGKKSWNVYNTANIDRVRRDEAEAKAREEEEARRQRAHDADRRLAILRGEAPPLSPQDEAATDHTFERNDAEHRRKRRRIAGENETDREMRWAREDAEAAELRAERSLQKSTTRRSNAPITDDRGHISLFPEADKKRSKRETDAATPAKNADYEAESAKTKQTFEDQYTMRFANAAGFNASVTQTPWYHNRTDRADVDDTTVEQILQKHGKDAWGNPDPRRREREKQRLNTADPLAMMKSGVRKLKEVENERNKLNAERKADLMKLMHEHRSEPSVRPSRTERSHHRAKGEDDAERKSDRRHRHHHRSRHHSRSRSRSCEHTKERDRDGLPEHRHHRHRHHHRHHDREKYQLDELQRRQRHNSPFVG